MYPSPTNPSSPPRAGANSLVVELVGPAGSGKTTLRKLLCDGQEPLVDAGIPTSAESLRQLAAVTLPLAPIYLRPGTADRGFTWDEIRSMLYLQGWLRQLPLERGDRLFDQGPVFRLAMLREFGPRMTRQTAFDNWLSRALMAWGQALDLVILLDAPNSELMCRIRGRAKAHRCKSLGDAEASVLLDRYRNAFENVLDAMQRPRGPRIVCLASDKQTPGQIAQAVRDELRQLRPREVRAAGTSLQKVVR